MKKETKKEEKTVDTNTFLYYLILTVATLGLFSLIFLIKSYLDNRDKNKTWNEKTKK